MVLDMYEQIREENRKMYGTEIVTIGDSLLSILYSERTHFLLELIQNAEDACQRAAAKKTTGISYSFKIQFSLFKDRLEVRHNGIPFDDSDVRGICRILKGTKQEDPKQIGKFGIGFKSVYAYTTSPEIYSGSRCFSIKDYVLPFQVQSRSDLAPDETLFIIPFNREGVSKEKAYQEIAARLPKLGGRTLLFIKMLERISWRTDESNGAYERHTDRKKPERISLYSYEKDRITMDEKWLVFSANETQQGLGPEVAYCLFFDDKTRRESIVRVFNSKLFAFFETAKETHLGFLINGPYLTTPSRDNIRLVDYNSNLIDETAQLVSKIIRDVKSLGLLDVSFLDALPIIRQEFEGNEFEQIFKRVKETLASKEALLPADEGGYVSCSGALIGRGKDLRNLISADKVGTLIGKKKEKWLNDGISQDKTPELRNYLMAELGIEEVDPERFARSIDDSFITTQSDEWIMRFYAFLLGRDALWKKKNYPWEEDGPLRTKVIIRLGDGRHSAPFAKDGTPLVCLPGKSNLSGLFQTVKDEFATDSRSKMFFEKLGLRQADSVDAILGVVLPLYERAPSTISEENNKQHVKWIVKTVSEAKRSGHERKEELLVKVKSSSFLLARNICTGAKMFKSPSVIYAGTAFSGSGILEIFFEGNKNVWMLDDRYLGILNTNGLTDLGCSLKIKVNYSVPRWDNNVVLEDDPGNHRRGLNGFDPTCDIEELDFALARITRQKSKVIWDLLKGYPMLISGIMESSTRKDFLNARQESVFSKMGWKLYQNDWLPLLDGSFDKPSDTFLNQLSDDFDKTSPEARLVAEKLYFKTNLEDKLIEQLGPERKEIYELLKSVSDDDLKRIKEGISLILKTSSDKLIPPPTISEVADKLNEGLHREGESDPGDNSAGQVWMGLTPEEQEEIRKSFGSSFQERFGKALVKEKRILHSKRIGEGEPVKDVKEYLSEQYAGHCQICNTRLELGRNKYYFDTLRLIEARDMLGRSDEDFNVLCLCPNCHAVAKYGEHDFRNIPVMARKASTGMAGSEPVPERHGDFYVIDVSLAGKPGKLFYTPNHMAKYQAFLDVVDKNGGD